MPRFYFNVHTVRGVTRDEKGQDFSSLEAARQEALRVLTDLPQAVASAVDRPSMLIEVTDETGKTVLNVPLPAGQSPSETRDPSTENDFA